MELAMLKMSGSGYGGGPAPEPMLATAPSGNGGDDHGAPSPPTAPAPLALYEAGVIIASRPVHALWEHVMNCELPSWQLLADAIYTLVMGIFRWHLCSQTLLLRGEALYHSLDGAFERVPSSDMIIHPLSLPQPVFTVEDLAEFSERYPHLLQTALYYRPSGTQFIVEPEDGHPMTEKEHQGAMKMAHYVSIPDFTDYTAINPAVLKEYFRRAYRELIDDADPCTITSLVNSHHLVQIDADAVRNTYGAVV